MIIYIRDNQGFYLSSVELDEFGPMPPASTTTPPPDLKDAQVASWVGNGWEVLGRRPPLPPPPDPAIASAAEKKAANDATIALLAAADLKIIRALAEGDTIRIEAHNLSQAALRDKIK
jgi:hypothetical protein